DEVVDYQHFLDYQTALRRNASEEESSNWLFVTIHGGLHSYTGASEDENMRYKATNKYLPDAFLSVGEEAPELSISHTTPGAFGWKWRIHGQTLSQTTLTPLFEEVYASGFMLY